MTVHTLVQPFWPHLAVHGSRARTVCASYRQAIDGELFKFRCMLLQTKPIQERGYVSYGHPFDAAQLNGVEAVSGGKSSRYSSSKGEACFSHSEVPGPADAEAAGCATGAGAGAGFGAAAFGAAAFFSFFFFGAGAGAGAFCFFSFFGAGAGAGKGCGTDRRTGRQAGRQIGQTSALQR